MELFEFKADENDRSIVANYLGEIKKNGKRAGELTRELLAFSKTQVLNPKIVDLNHIIRDLEPMLRRLLGEDISILLSLDSNRFTRRKPRDTARVWGFRRCTAL